jgi:hypothetical protein
LLPALLAAGLPVQLLPLPLLLPDQLLLVAHPRAAPASDASPRPSLIPES